MMQELEKPEKKQPLTNAEKQKRYRIRQQLKGKKEVRGYLSKEAMTCYALIAEQTNWSDSTLSLIHI